MPAFVLAILLAAATVHAPSELIGTWRGTSTCTDRVAAPACKDEVVIYDFTPGDAGKVHGKADKVVGGERLTMGEFDFAYDEADACWKDEYVSPSVHFVLCLAVKGDRLDGSGWVLPGKKVVRKIEARRE